MSDIGLRPLLQATAIRPLWGNVVVLTLAAVAACVALAKGQEKVVVLRPDQDLAAVVAGHPAGTHFRFAPGIYRQQTIYPKDRQRFTGGGAAVLNGARVLRHWTRVGGAWRSQGLPPPLSFHGECADGSERCLFQEDLFVDGQLFKRVATRGELGPGRWAYSDRRAFLGEDPKDRLVEIGLTPVAFAGDAEGVVLEGLIIEKYASDAQEGAIYADEGRGWQILNVVARWNHGAGLSFGPRTQVRGGAFHHNGQIGIVGEGDGARLEGVEIAHNNYAGYDPRWEAGGTKFWSTTGLVVIDTCVHHNDGPGLWADHDNIHTVYEGNRVFANGYEGIKHEISYDAVIRNNIVSGNATSGTDNWLWGAQILIQDSRNVRVENNVVEVSAGHGNGIAIIYQDRGEGAFGPWISVDNEVLGNEIVHLGRSGASGIANDTNKQRLTDSNRFDRNIYKVQAASAQHWRFQDQQRRWEEVRALGYEAAGGRVVRGGNPLAQACEPQN